MQLSSVLAADVLGISRKRLDNLLLSLGMAGRQGRSRELGIETVETLALTLLLQRDLGVSAARASEFAAQLRQSESGVAPLGVLGSLHFDMGRLRSVLQNALASAVEDHRAPRRGRPRGAESK
jgi:hypothetical protein